MNRKKNNPFEEVGMAIGVGLLAGLAGTAAITLSQMIEMKITGRKPGTTPEQAVEKTLDIGAVSEEKKEKVSQEVHWVYGTAWGVSRGLMRLAGLKGWVATLTHFSAVWGTSLVMLPALGLSRPVQEQEVKSTLIDALHHAVYATATGLVVDAIEG
ncbi:MAG TPA: hypothetical protein VHC48_10720 [Puia sp.]|jgi:hypothetical protein|nr:hypothetical protein [Puia sp.]